MMLTWIGFGVWGFKLSCAICKGGSGACGGPFRESGWASLPGHWFPSSTLMQANSLAGYQSDARQVQRWTSDRAVD